MRSPGEMPEDILIIGSGVGGLTAGIILAKLGCRVRVVEKNSLPGGLMRSYVRSGIDCPVGVHYLGSLGEGQPLRRLWDYLGVTSSIPLERMGANGAIDRYVFDDFSFDLREGIDTFERDLRESFPEDHGPITKIMGDLRGVARSLSSLDGLMSPGMTILSPESLDPMGEQLLRLGCSTALRSVLGVPSALIGVPLRDCPGFYYHMTLASYLLSSWRLACSGADMADAFVNRLQALGGEAVPGDGVERILVQSGKVKGTVLQSGRILEAAVVIAAIHPRNIISLLPADAVRPASAERIAGLENTKGLFSVILTLDAETQQALPYNVYRIHPEKDGTLLKGIFHQLRPSAQPGVTTLSIMTTSGIEEWRQWEDTSSGRRGRDYSQAKEARARCLIDEASRLLGPLGERKILDIYTPLTIRDRVNSPDGSAYGILRSARQLLKTTSLHRLLGEGLYLAGQNSLAPGIMGTMLGSFQAVRHVIGQERFNREIREKLP